MSFDPELEAFRTQIDLRQYAASIGFALLKDKSSRSSAVMRRDADKIVIKCNAGDGHFVYFVVSQAIRVEPDPPKGSNTTSRLLLLFRMALWTNSTGFIVGCRSFAEGLSTGHTSP